MKRIRNERRAGVGRELSRVLFVAWGLGLCGAVAVEAPADPEQYFDDRFSFAVEYPAGWHAEIADENKDEVPDYVMKRSIYFKSHGPATFMIFVWSNREELDLISWFRANYLDLMSYPEEAPTAINAEVLGQPAVRFVNRQMTTCAMEIAMFQHQDWVYMLLYRNCDDGASRPLFEHFVSSFTGAQ